MKKDNIILEFNGLPGSGKSAISNEIMALPNHSEDQFIFFDNFIKDELSHSKFIEIGWLMSLLVNPFNLLFVYYSFCLLRTVRKITRERLRRVYRFVSLYFIYKRISKKMNGRIFIVDQGMIQQVLSIIYLDQLHNEGGIEKLFNHIKKTLPNYYLVNTDVPVQQVVGRIQARGKLDSRIDLLPENEMLPALEVQRVNLEKIRILSSQVKLPSLTIDTTLNPKQNARLILGWLDFYRHESHRHLQNAE